MKIHFIFFLFYLFVIDNTNPSEKKKKEIVASKEAINRWTDNIFSVQSWCKIKFGIDNKTMCQNFGIPDELDYID